MCPLATQSPAEAAGGAQAQQSAQAQMKLHSEAPHTFIVSYHCAAALQLQTKIATLH